MMCSFDGALCRRLDMPVLRHAAPEALRVEPQAAKAVAAKMRILDSSWDGKRTSLNNDVKSLDGLSRPKKSSPGALFRPRIIKEMPLKTSATSNPSNSFEKPSKKTDEKLRLNSKSRKENANVKNLNRKASLAIPGALGVSQSEPVLQPKSKVPADLNKPKSKPAALRDLSSIDQEGLNNKAGDEPSQIFTSKPQTSQLKQPPKQNPKPELVESQVKKTSNQLTETRKITNPQSTKCFPNRRKEIRELKKDELKAYVNAIKKLHSKKRPDQVSKYDRYAEIHVNMHQQIHGVPAFLPWHRQFIRKYELELQQIDPSVTLPYWDWTIDSQYPTKSPVLTSAMFGGNGNKKKDMCVTDGPFANWMVTTPKPHCLRRDYAGGTTIPALTSIDVMTGLLNDLTEYSEFSFQLEVHHGPIHLDIGGERGDLNPMHSPNDPLFFLHHTFVDMLWYNWQMKHPSSEPYNGIAHGRPVSVNDKLIPLNVTVKDVLNTRAPGLCYFYNPYHPKVESLATRTGFSFDTLANHNVTKAKPSKNKEEIKLVRHLSEDWLRKNHLDVARAREVEKQRDTATANLNALGITPASGKE
ncbi:hypothetical protein L0F63_005999 [Massospora cicadina]|nr:hypothetical protein L0F63_005999 [Massospora cicadina]